MIGYYCFLLLVGLALRSLILFLFESKPWSSRLADLLLAVLFGTSAYLVFVFLDLTIVAKLSDLLPLIVAGVALIGILVAIRLRKPYQRNSMVLWFKAMLFVIIILLTFVVLMMTGFLYFLQDEPVLKITMTGKSRSEYVEWQPPNGQPQKGNLTAYEVLFDTTDEKRIAQLFVYGDEVAVKAKVLRFRPILNMLGFRNLCRIEYVHNGYATAERFNQYPHRAQEIPFRHPALAAFQRPFWSFWEGSYFARSDNWWIKSATLESNYFPLRHPDGAAFRGSYYLTITFGGLSSIPLP